MAGHKTFGGFECHHLFDGVQLQLFKLGLALGLVIQLATDGALDQVQRSAGKLVSSHHGIHGTDFQCVFSAVFFTGGDPLNGIVDANQAWQANGATKPRVDAQLHFWQADFGAVCHDTEVRCQAHFQTAAQCNAIDGRNGRNIQVFEITEDFVGFEVACDQLGIWQLEVFDEFGDVGTDDKYIFTAGNNDTLDRSICLDRIYRLTQFVQG